MTPSQRALAIPPFYVMEMAKTAGQLARSAPADRPMLYLNIGEPDFTAPPAVQEAAARAIRDGKTSYTPALGLPRLRERISHWYRQRFGLDIPARRIVITAGASAALHLVCLALVDPGDEILMADPGYPCNRQFVQVAGGQARLLPCGPLHRYQPSATQIRDAWSSTTRGILLASPSNPTGTSVDPAELQAMHEVVSARGGATIVDEIYLGLSYEDHFRNSVLALGDSIISINSFSKYFCMTGWRLGWLVAPDALLAPIEQLAQHLYICPSAIAQRAALACFEDDSLAEYETRRAQFKARRDWFVPQMNALGLPVPVMPDGAFYAWADCRRAMTLLADRTGSNIDSSWDFALALMRHAGIAVTPGRDFGHADTEHCIRFSTASAMPQLQEAVQRLRPLLG